MRSGLLNKRAAFERRMLVDDNAGGNTEAWAPLVTVWAQFAPERGRERIQAGRLDAALAGVLRIRSSIESRGIVVTDRATIDGHVYNIRSIANPDQRGRVLELAIESAV